MKKTFILLLALVLVSSFTLAQGRNAMKIHQDYEVEVDTSISLSQEEIDGLLLMREEEKLARDVYTTLYEAHQLQIFSNIASSEQTHTDAVKKVLDAYNIEDPVSSDEVGVFQNEELAELYNSLVVQGSESLLEGLKVGARVEDLDINDLNGLLDKTENGALILIYSNLNKGSRNHIRSFISQIENNGGSYEAQYISQEELDEILAGEIETGAILNENSDINNGLLQQKLLRQQTGNKGNGIAENGDVKQQGVSNALQMLQQNNFQNKEFGMQVSEYARQFQHNYDNAISYENRISERSGFSRFFMGGDRNSASMIQEQVRSNNVLIEELTNSLTEASEIDAEYVRAQIRGMQEENNRLNTLAEQENSKKGLFRWW